MGEVNWNYYDKFADLQTKYLPADGEGETLATQAVTAVCKLVYKWYNDGDVFDNTYTLKGWWNDLSSYANWLYKHLSGEVPYILEGIEDCATDDDYEDLLQQLADAVFDEEYLKGLNSQPKLDSIYKCDGPFKYVECDEEEEYY